MSLGIDSAIDFNDAPGWRGFMLAHRFAHDQFSQGLRLFLSSKEPGGILFTKGR